MNHKTVEIDYSKKYGKLTPLEEVEVRKNGQKWRMIKCKCDCGREKLINIYTIVSGHSKSCGCSTFKHTAEKASIHRHGLRNTRLYHIWTDMKQRCYNPNHEAYNRYGGSGITVCKEWMENPVQFFKWAQQQGYNESLTVDRIDNCKGYCPENCRLASMKEQARNRKSSIKITFNGVEKPLAEWAEELDIPYYRLFDRINSGWTIEKALTTPLLRSGKRKDGIPRKSTDNFKENQ